MCRSLFAVPLLIAALLPTAVHGGTYAVLIGVQTHKEAEQNLLHAKADVALLRKVLMERAVDTSPEQILELSDIVIDGANSPTSANVLRDVPAFLKKLTDKDQLIFYFSGHGMLDGGQTYLVLQDFKKSAPKVNSLPMSQVQGWLKECKALTKFVILDCCHAGGSSGTPASGDDMAKSIDPKVVERCVVYASCTANQKSYEWNERGQGVFTYWLSHALSGAAVGQGGKVEITAVERYVTDRVQKTSAVIADKPDVQRPQLIGTLSGSQPIILVKQELTDTVCERTAAHLDLEIRMQNWKSVGVFEFLVPIGTTEGAGVNTTPLYCAEKIREHLTKWSSSGPERSRYQVVDTKILNTAAKNVVLENSSESTKLMALAEKVKNLQGVIWGTLKRNGSFTKLTTELYATSDGSSVLESTGLIGRTESTEADAAAAANKIRQNPDGTFVQTAPKPITIDQAIKRNGEDQLLPSPLFDAKCPFRIEILSKKTGKPIPLRIDPKSPAAVIGVSDKEEFEIDVVTTHADRVGLVLLADGINTLDQKLTLVENAKLWILEPKANNENERRYRIKGWTIATGQVDADKKAIFRTVPFQFVQPQNSVAGRMKFSESLGLLTAVFLREVPIQQARDVFGVGGIEEKAFTVALDTAPFVRGEHLTRTPIRYVDEATAAKFEIGVRK